MSIRRIPWFAALLVLAFAAYAIAYIRHPWLPGNVTPEGWFGGWDQMMYRRHARFLTELDFRVYYPPIFPWLGAPFVRWMPNHTYFIPDFVCLAIHLYGIARIGERYFGRTATALVICLLLVAFPKIWLDQWVIPWTSSGVGALSSVLFLLYDRNKYPGWFFLAYGAVFATRPLDVIPLFPLALAMAWQNKREWPIIGAAGLLFPLFYLGLNWYTEGDPLGGYIRISRNIGFVFNPDRAVSLWVDSVGIYNEPGQSIGAYFPLFVPALLLCIVAMFRSRGTVRLIATAVVINTFVYTAYSDIFPGNLLANNVVHYFKWTIPWLLLIAIAQAVDLVRWKRTITLVPLSICAFLIMTLRVSLVTVLERQTSSGPVASIALPEIADFDAVDVVGIEGGFKGYDSAHEVTVDGIAYRGPANVRALRMEWGTRFYFPKGVTGQKIVVRFPEPYSLKGTPVMRVSRVRLGYWRRP